MNPEVKAKWLAALRSGEYTQGTGTLRDEFDNFCCLGVLCAIAVKDGLEIDVAAPGENGAWSYDGEEWFLPPKVSYWAGMDKNDPRIAVSGYTRVSDLNDDAGMTFEQIADVIEVEL